MLRTETRNCIFEHTSLQRNFCGFVVVDAFVLSYISVYDNTSSATYPYTEKLHSEKLANELIQFSYITYIIIVRYRSLLSV